MTTKGDCIRCPAASTAQTPEKVLDVKTTISIKAIVVYDENWPDGLTASGDHGNNKRVHLPS